MKAAILEAFIPPALVVRRAPVEKVIDRFKNYTLDSQCVSMGGPCVCSST